MVGTGVGRIGRLARGVGRRYAWDVGRDRGDGSEAGGGDHGERRGASGEPIQAVERAVAQPRGVARIVLHAGQCADRFLSIR